MAKPQFISVREQVAHLVAKRNYATHGFDRYPAKMIPQLARFGIERCTEQGQLVFDPFCGCGTVLIEARISGRRAVGIDINPYAVLLAKAKVRLYKSEVLRRAIATAVEVAQNLGVGTQASEWLLYWFHPHTLKQLFQLRIAIERLETDFSPSYIDALKAVLAVTVRLSSKADPRSPKPFISKRAQRVRAERVFDAFQIFAEQGKRFVSASAELRKLVKDGRATTISISCGDARQLKEASSQRKYDAIVSSPPYLSAQDYFRSSKLEIAILGLAGDNPSETLGPLILGSGRGQVALLSDIELENLPLEVRKLNNADARAAAVVAHYLDDIRTVVRGCWKNLKGNGKCCLVIGDSTIRGIPLPVHRWISELTEAEGFTLKEHFVDTVRDRRLPPQRVGHESVIKHEHILVFAKA